MKLAAGALIVSLVIAVCPAASAHPVDRVTARSICHYEERYFVWDAGERWRVWGRLKPAHGNKKVVLQKSKYGRNWREWKGTRTAADGTYRFTGTATRRNNWWINLRVVFRSQGDHSRRVSLSMYIDTNPLSGC
jgi:hypothetical protein